MASVFLYHVVGDLTVGKPEVSEFSETETVSAAIRAIGSSSEGAVLLWKKRSQNFAAEKAESRQQRFVGILNALDIVAFLARDESLADTDKALATPVSEVVAPNNSALKVVDPATRLIDALEMMKQGVKRLLVPKSLVWRGMSKRFSFLYSGKPLKNVDPSSANLNRPSSSSSSSSSTTSSMQDKFCCLSREDVLRFLIGCLGALAPLPLSSISSLGAVNPNFSSVRDSSPAIEAAQNLPHDPSAVAVVETAPDGVSCRILGDISSVKLWKCDYLAAAWALANLSARKFVVNGGGDDATATATATKWGRVYRGRSDPLTCRESSSVAAVMAQMLSHRATHVWVTREEDCLVGVVGYADILAAVTGQPPLTPTPAPPSETQ